MKKTSAALSFIMAVHPLAHAAVSVRTAVKLPLSPALARPGLPPAALAAPALAPSIRPGALAPSAPAALAPASADAPRPADESPEASRAEGARRFDGALPSDGLEDGSASAFAIARRERPDAVVVAIQRENGGLWQVWLREPGLEKVRSVLVSGSRAVPGPEGVSASLYPGGLKMEDAYEGALLAAASEARKGWSGRFTPASILVEAKDDGIRYRFTDEDAKEVVVKDGRIIEQTDYLAPPEPAAPRLSLPSKSFTLDNGLKVVVHTDKTAPVVAVSITYRVGSRHERRGLAGFAHLFEHLMAQGTKSLKPREISQLIESNGGVRNAYTMRSNTTYHSAVPKSALKTVLWAEAERMSTLDVDERALALEQQVVTEEMRLRYVNAAYAKARDAGMAETAFTKWENHHTTIGEAKEIRNAKLEDVRAFYKAHYAPNNATIALAGDVTEDEARALVGRFFGPLERREIAPSPDDSEPPMAASTRRVIDDKFAKVPLLMTGWRAPERGTTAYWALTLLAEILGGGDDSPLYQSLVKDAKVALSVSSNFPWWTGPFNPGGPDLFGFMMPLKPGASADAALALTDRVLAAAAERGVTADELAAAKTRIELSWTKDFEQLAERAKTLSSYAALVGDPAGLSEDFARLMAISAADVKAAAAEWLASKPRAVVEARPAPDAVLPADVPTPPIPEQRPRPEGDPRPELDPQPAMKAPNIERFTLSNGLKVAFVRDARLPLLEARLSIPGGRISEARGEEGLSAAAAELLLSGAGDKDAKALASELARQGWRLSVSRGMEELSIGAAGLSRNAPAFFLTLADVLTRPTFPESELALWRENKVQELKISRSKPDFMADVRLRAELFPDHPYGKAPLTDEQVAAVTRERVAAWTSRALSFEGATLVLTGDADPASLRANLEEALGGWRKPASASAAPATPDAGAARLALVDRPGSRQANLTVSQAVALQPGHPDYLAFQVANQILGGSATSRLFVNLRVDKGYTYGAYSRPSLMKRTMLWSATAEVRNEVAAPALAEIRKEIARLRDEKVPEAALASVKKYLGGLFLLRSASIDSQADVLASYERQGLNAERELATYLERLNALTPEDIQRVARLYLDPERMVTVVVGDEAALAPVLR